MEDINVLNRAPPIYRGGRMHLAQQAQPELGSSSAWAEQAGGSEARALPSRPDGSPVASQAAPGASSELEQWQSNLAPVDTSSRLGPAKSRKSNGVLGIVWPGSGARNGAPVSVAPSASTPFFSMPSASRKNLAPTSPALRASLAGGPSPRETLSQSAAAAAATAAAAAASRHHRLGTEEVALHTPIHSHPSNDYEWKRVENSRWNNLRGMWGKRAISDKNGPFDDRFKEWAEQAEEARAFLQAAAPLARPAGGFGAGAGAGDSARDDDEALAAALSIGGGQDQSIKAM